MCLYMFLASWCVGSLKSCMKKWCEMCVFGDHWYALCIYWEITSLPRRLRNIECGDGLWSALERWASLSRQDTESQFFNSWAFCLFSIFPLPRDSLLLSVHCWTEDLSGGSVAEATPLSPWRIVSHRCCEICVTHGSQPHRGTWQCANLWVHILWKAVWELQHFVFQLTLHHFLALQMCWRCSRFMNTKHKGFLFFSPWSIWRSQ